MDKLSTTQKVWAYLSTHSDDNGVCDRSFEEMAEALGLKSTAVVDYHIRRLVEMGHIRKPPHTKRLVIVDVKFVTTQRFVIHKPQPTGHKAA